MPRESLSGAKMQTKRSAWTPQNPVLNRKLFEERQSLVLKWFDGWPDRQRKAMLQDFVQRCSVDQLRFLSVTVSRRLPLQAADFTCALPRALSLYVFSFLDPRSLSRCAQVSWHWRSIVELDQLWMPKCVKLGWCANPSPTPFVQGIWKRHYIQSVQELRRRRPDPQACYSTKQELEASQNKGPPEPELINKGSPASVEQTNGNASSLRLNRSGRRMVLLPPWRDPDRHPKDIVRFNYLDNLDSIEQDQKMRDRSHTFLWNKSGTEKKKPLTETAYKLRKAKSLMFLSCDEPTRPSPPPPHSEQNPISLEAARQLLSLPQWNAGTYPRPVMSPVPRLGSEAVRAFGRSSRSAPCRPLFTL